MGLWLEVAIDKSAHKIKIVGSYRNARGIKGKDAHISEHPQGISQRINLTRVKLRDIIRMLRGREKSIARKLRQINKTLNKFLT